jgi:hypothetical protein
MVVKSTGRVLSIMDGVASVSGLSGVRLGELVSIVSCNFTRVAAVVLNLREKSVGVVIFGDDSLLAEGDLVIRSHSLQILDAVFSKIGRVFSPSGSILYEYPYSPLSSEKSRLIEMKAPGIILRKSVSTPIVTGKTPIKTQDFSRKRPKLATRRKKLLVFLWESFKTLLFMALSSVAIYYAGGVFWLFMQILTLFILPENLVDLVVDPPIELKPATSWLALVLGLEIFQFDFIVACMIAGILTYYDVG